MFDTKRLTDAAMNGSGGRASDAIIHTLPYYDRGVR